MGEERRLEQTVQWLKHRLVELSAWRDRLWFPLSGRFQAAGSGEWLSVREGDPWPSREFPVRMEFTATLPEAWAGLPVSVRLAVGGEARLMVNGRLVGGLNPYHKEYLLLEKAQGAQELALELEAVPKGLFGTPNFEPRLEEARLLVPDLEVRAFLEDLAAVLEAAGYLLKRGRLEVAALLADALEASLSGLQLPRTPSQGYLARLVQAPEAASVQASVWDEWRFEAEPLALPESLRPELLTRREVLRAALEAIKARYPAEGRLWLSGHAHIDLAWLWPFEETRRKIRRTFGTVLTLMERYPHFHYNQSSAQAYAFVEEDDPELFERIQERVREGRWDVVGGMWVEPDGNLLSGESWARQLLYGQRYFQSRFGKRAAVCWLPDTFGYTANLPQLLQQAGIPYFFTTKLNWNETNAFPHDLYYWEGLDGSRVIAHSFLNPNQGYNGNLQAYDLGETWRNFKGKRLHDESLFSFGWGDGGGGPTTEMLERFERLKDFPGLPRLEMGTVEAFYRRVERQARGQELPVWVGEQYLELHRGTYTTQSRVKWYHRRLEHVLPEAEAAATLAWRLLGEAYPKDQLYTAWTTLLRHHFHDVLPGSSVHAVYEAAHRDLGATLQRAEGLREAALGSLSKQVGLGRKEALAKVVVWNLTLEERPLRLDLPKPLRGPFRLVAPGPGDLEVPYQDLGERIVVETEQLSVPGLGYVALAAVPGTPKEPSRGLEVSASTLENRYLRVRVAPDGTLTSVSDKEAGREALAGRGNQIWAYTDIPREWEAWDVDSAYAQDGVEVLASAAPVVVEEGPFQAALRVERRLEGALIEQFYRLRASARRLEIETRIRWERRRTLLRAYFPLNVRQHEAWFETAYGAVARPTHRNTSWDAARFEVSGHRWADLSEAGYGVSLLNDGKYGHSALGNVVGLTLLRSPLYPDPLADEGEHRFTYALYPHRGDWRNGTILEAHDLNAPLRAIVLPAEGGNWPSVRQLVRISAPGLRLSALKRSEEGEGVVLRLYEAHGGRGRAVLESELATGAARRVNLLEEAQEELLLEGTALRLDFTPYRVISLEL
ncbi:alpha-mannosidase [Calidithermus roseus]|uniref:Mannosylglycerate hydrolase n=1 Tax=Calidithermus roseus TaxID=1644118 RepID=A0A399ES09_9DEIN|nr:glycoside hydrolase family 38 C-terminal domain-containing protein [Calidithermus roseus]RIH85829.1 Mannosylglycerate hydrolase [Calidithermus roseus]